MTAALRLSRFGVAFGEKVVLADVTLEIPARGPFVLLGPAGGGKSTLARTLAGLNDAQPALRTWGEALYLGEPLSPTNRPALVLQDARLFTSTPRENLAAALTDRTALSRSQQTERLTAFLETAGERTLLSKLDRDAVELDAGDRRVVAVLRALIAQPALVCLDESTAQLGDADAARILDLVAWYADRHAVLFISHQQQHARAVGGACALLAGGAIQETADTRAFFLGPATSAGIRFVRTGNCNLPSPGTPDEALEEGAPRSTPLPPEALAPPQRTVGPRGFHWLVPGKLGGLPRPGIVAPLEADLDGLQRLGVTVLVTLEETETVPPELLRTRGIRPLWFPVRDMEAPSPEVAAAWCQELSAHLRAGDVVAVHCRAGLGRTGTVLACHLIWNGATAVEALESVRGIQPRWVQSEAQVAFLQRYFEFVRRIREHSAGAED